MKEGSKTGKRICWWSKTHPWSPEGTTSPGCPLPRPYYQLLISYWASWGESDWILSFFLWAVLVQTAFPYAGVAGGCSLLFGGGDACPVRAKLGSKGLWYYATAINAQPWSCIRLYASSPGIALTKLLRALKKLWWLQIICTWVENNGLDSYEYTADLKWCGQSELGQKDLSWV